MTTLQAQIKTALENAGIASREIQVYGSQIVITSGCRDTAEKWASLIAKFATVRGIVETVDYTKRPKAGRLVSTVKVWRTFGRI